MTETHIPKTMKAWLFNDTKGGAEKHLYFSPKHPLPPSFHNPPPGFTLVRILFAALNPVDLKIAELPLVGHFAHRLPATPGLDFTGRVVHSTTASLAPGTLVAGKLPDRTRHGALAEFALVSNTACAPVPPGIPHEQASAVGTCGATAVQALREVQAGAGQRVFINGGSGGTGVFQIQVAKALGCTVVVACSGGNVELCRGLGADEALDYTVRPAGEVLAERVAGSKGEGMFDLVVDNVGARPWVLFKLADGFLRGGVVQVGLETGWKAIWDVLRISIVPGFLGGGRNSWRFLAMQSVGKDMERVLAWMAEGKVRVPIDEVVEFEDVPGAYARLKTHRTRGKIVVRVADDDEA